MGVRERLADLMRTTGQTNQSELARRLDPPESPTWINNRLTGYSAIKADEIPRLARALGVPCSAFFEGSGCPEEAKKGPPSAAAEHDLLLEEYMKAAVSDLPEEERHLVDAVLALRRRYRLRDEGEPDSEPGRSSKARQSDPARD